MTRVTHGIEKKKKKRALLRMRLKKRKETRTLGSQLQSPAPHSDIWVGIQKRPTQNMQFSVLSFTLEKGGEQQINQSPYISQYMHLLKCCYKIFLSRCNYSALAILLRIRGEISQSTRNNNTDHTIIYLNKSRKIECSLLCLDSAFLLIPSSRNLLGPPLTSCCPSTSSS